MYTHCSTLFELFMSFTRACVPIIPLITHKMYFCRYSSLNKVEVHDRRGDTHLGVGLMCACPTETIIHDTKTT
ncbi:hypothetical protein PR001_g24840 [Phytophthora rubi]|uniref:Uncharacterized protein n=1 Tax=Phytophthora rubi TaxID=129364 RepID=A0A6A3IF79_9STRA|nr:hypothetical protein PR001_g24840 [Phytophthora rubi]